MKKAARPESEVRGWDSKIPGTMFPEQRSESNGE